MNDWVSYYGGLVFGYILITIAIVGLVLIGAEIYIKTSKARLKKKEQKAIQLIRERYNDPD